MTVEAEPVPTFQWYKDNRPISHANTSVLAFSQLAPSDQGAYSLQACNLIDCRESLTVTLRLNQAPALLQTLPETAAVVPGQSLVLEVLVQGTPYPTIQWYRNAVALPGEALPELAIAQVTEADQGLYTVVLRNRLGQVRYVCLPRWLP
jgi:hypothetical protein